jgi:hypothetical protein
MRWRTGAGVMVTRNINANIKQGISNVDFRSHFIIQFDFRDALSKIVKGKLFPVWGMWRCYSHVSKVIE